MLSLPWSISKALPHKEFAPILSADCTSAIILTIFLHQQPEEDTKKDVGCAANMELEKTPVAIAPTVPPNLAYVWHHASSDITL